MLSDHLAGQMAMACMHASMVTNHIQALALSVHYLEIQKRARAQAIK